MNDVEEINGSPASYTLSRTLAAAFTPLHVQLRVSRDYERQEATGKNVIPTAFHAVDRTHFFEGENFGSKLDVTNL